MTKEMEMTNVDWRILKHAQPDVPGYINDERASLLMEEGLLVKTPPKKWHIEGHKATPKGIKLFNDFMKKTRDTHKHVWMTTNYGDGKVESDCFAYSEGYHNGYKCSNCGLEVCNHCTEEWEVPPCGTDSRNLTMSSDANLDQSIVALDSAFR